MATKVIQHKTKTGDNFRAYTFTSMEFGLVFVIEFFVRGWQTWMRQTDPTAFAHEWEQISGEDINPAELCAG